MDTINEQMTEVNETPLVWEDPTTDEAKKLAYVQTPEQIGEKDTEVVADVSNTVH